jgi:5'-methylthioinosine phosphorylase
MGKIAVIGGTGLTMLNGLSMLRREVVQTPWGEPSGPLTYGEFQGREIIFFARHGYGHTIPPHQVNYRANIWAMQSAGVGTVIAVAAVGGIAPECAPGALVIPDQIIDYTHSRGATFFEGDLKEVTHIDFTEPYCPQLRAQLIAAARAANLGAVERGVYGATQGPRLETTAEINRLERDGCTLVGMTGMPEAALARELGLCYAACAVVANPAAGRGSGAITMQEIEATLQGGIAKVRSLLEHVLPLLD